MVPFHTKTFSTNFSLHVLKSLLATDYVACSFFPCSDGQKSPVSPQISRFSPGSLIKL